MIDKDLPGFSALPGLRDLDHGDRDWFLNPGSTVFNLYVNLIFESLFRQTLLSIHSSQTIRYEFWLPIKYCGGIQL